MAKPRYTAIIFTGDKNIGNDGFIKWRAVTNINRLEKNVIERYPLAKFVTIYDKQTREKIRVTTF